MTVSVIKAMLLCASMIFMAGCTLQEKEVSVTDSSLSSTSIAASDSYMVPLVKNNYFDYQLGMECAAFSSAFLLRHYGEEADGMKLFETFPDKAQDGGIMPTGIVKFFKDRGYEAEYIVNGTADNLKEELNKGNPVIVFIHLEEPYTSVHNTHYIPLVGYDSQYFYFAESLEDYANCKDEAEALQYNRKTEISKFVQLWKNIDGVWDYPYFVITRKAE